MLGNIVDTNYDFPPIDKFTKVAGVTFGNIQNILPKLTNGMNVSLVRDPANEYDRNAIRVMVKCRANNIQVGWINKELAKVLAPEIDAGIEWKAKIEKVIGAEYDNKGLLISLKYEDAI